MCCALDRESCNPGRCLLTSLCVLGVRFCSAVLCVKFFQGRVLLRGPLPYDFAAQDRGLHLHIVDQLGVNAEDIIAQNH